MAAKKQTKKTAKSKKRQKGSSFNMTPEKKSLIIRGLGVALFIFVIFSLVASVSYLFTWKEDQSLIGHSSVSGDDVANVAGAAGLKWAHFLIADCLGIGSLVLILLFGFYAIRIFFWKSDIKVLRLTFIAVSLAFIVSMVLSLFGSGSEFGRGLGGASGHAVIAMLSATFGNIITGFLVFLLAAVWLLCVNGRFASWFANAGDKVGSKMSKDLDVFMSAETDEEDAKDKEDGAKDESGNQDGGYGYHVFPVADEPAPTPPVTPTPPVPPVPPVPPAPPVSPAPPVPPVPPVPSVPQDEPVAADATVLDPLVSAAELPPIDHREGFESFVAPSLDLLGDYAGKQYVVSDNELEINKGRIRNTLENYKINILDIDASVGPTVTLYKVFPASGVRVSSIEKLHREIAIALGTSGVRVVMLHDSVGIEVPNDKPSLVPLKTMLSSASFCNTKAELPISIGYTITREVKTFDLTSAPHLLVAGATMQGKSVCLNVIIASLLYAKHPSELKFVFIDPKMVEFTAYASLLKHYLAVLPTAQSEDDERKKSIVKTPQQAEQVLNALCIEMDERYKLLADAGVNGFKNYNEKYKKRLLLPTEGHKYMPYLVVVIDEYADLVMAGGSGAEAKKSAKHIESSIIRLAQKGRAAGIHVIIATQRPSVNVITGLIKANFPTRIAFRVLSGADSKTILDTTGAENLIGKGDMLYYAGVSMERVQCAFVDMKEIKDITNFIGQQTNYKQCSNTPYYLPVPVAQDGEAGGGNIDMQNIDAMFEDAARMVVTTQKGSTSDLQRKLGMGYARAGRVMDQLEAAGIVGPQDGSRPRRVLVADLQELEEILQSYLN